MNGKLELHLASLLQQNIWMTGCESCDPLYRVDVVARAAGINEDFDYHAVATLSRSSSCKSYRQMSAIQQGGQRRKA